MTQTRLARVRAGPVASLVPEGLRAFAVPSTLPRDRSRRATASTSWPRSARASPTRRPSSRAWRCCWSSARRPRQVRTTGYRSTPRRRASGPERAGAARRAGQQEDLAFARAFADLAVTVERPRPAREPGPYAAGILGRVEERDGRGRRIHHPRWRLHLDRVPGEDRLDRNPHVPDVALEPRRPDQVGDPTCLPSCEGRPGLGDLEGEGVARHLDADQLAAHAPRPPAGARPCR